LPVPKTFPALIGIQYQVRLQIIPRRRGRELALSASWKTVGHDGGDASSNGRTYSLGNATAKPKMPNAIRSHETRVADWTNS